MEDLRESIYLLIDDVLNDKYEDELHAWATWLFMTNSKLGSVTQLLIDLGDKDVEQEDVDKVLMSLVDLIAVLVAWAESPLMIERVMETAKEELAES